MEHGADNMINNSKEPTVEENVSRKASKSMKIKPG
jgi:hypothetical protein